MPRAMIPEPIDAYRARLYRLLFAAAAVYNITFGLWASLRPFSFFRRFEMAAPNYPAVWACLGMVVGVYGIAYGYAACRLERAVPFAAIGLLGKVLGPLGWVATVRSGEWPLRTFTLVLFNDLIWWVPFSLFLLEGGRLVRLVRSWSPYACALLNFGAASLLLFGLRPGTELAPDPGKRLVYIAAHPLLWRAGWAVWIAAGISLVGFYAWWGSRLPRGAPGIAAVVVAAVGLLFDLFAESLLIGWLPSHDEAIASMATLFSGAIANGLYTLGGAILTLGSTEALRSDPGGPARAVGLGRLRAWAWATWSAGLLLTVASLCRWPLGIALSAGTLFALFCPLAAAIGWRLR